MPVNNMNVGVDYTFGYFDALTGQLINLGQVQSVHVTKHKHDIKSTPFNGIPLYGYVPDGYRIEFHIVRDKSTLEDFQIVVDQNFNQGSITPSGFLNQTTNNADGTVSRYQYTGFVFNLTDHGDVSREKVVTLRAEGMASDKINLGASA
jgi:hypothetical protein